MDGEYSRDDQLETIIQDSNSEPRDLSLAYLKKITNEFADELLLGEGGFGKVYKGVLQNGRIVAVKKLFQLKPGLQAKQFENEVYHLMRLKHPNIVRFVGYCYETQNECVEFNGRFIFAEKQQRLLCLEYLSNGSLDGHLSDESSGLDWGTRYKIIKGICCGIHYLHEKCKYQINGSIIHLDLKPANILLDNNMVPKVADFGLSRLFHGTQTQTCTTNLVGTFAYMAPEYIYKHVITTKADIYSLGVLIIEIITGDRPDPFSFNSTSSEDFLEAVLQKWRNRLKDAPLETDCNQIKLCLEIGLKCFKVDRNERPTAKEIFDSLDEWERRNSVDKHKLEENTNPVDNNGDALQVPDPAGDKVLSLSRGREGNSARPVIPDDFRCPISQDLMNDPVIVATGQTYERGYIEMWLAGHDTCPKTHQKLANKSLTPNYVLCSFITRWCETNGIEPPKRPAQLRDAPLPCSAAEHSNVLELLQKLSSHNLEDQRGAAGMLRRLAKCSAENRACIGDAGAIPILASMLSTTDVSTQEHVVTALLNLSIYEENKARIISSGAVPGIVHVLKRGSMEARENSAATLFSLSTVDENKVTIGGSGAIPALVQLLSDGSQRGKKDAATALFNLCIYQGNKSKAVRAGLVPILLMETESGMVDEAFAILSILSNHSEGKAAIDAASAIPVLVGVIRNGSLKSKENAAAVMVNLCNGEGGQQQQHLAEAAEQGIVPLLEELAESGTDRGKRKAVQLLQRMRDWMIILSL